jgi:hypothetical protein
LLLLIAALVVSASALTAIAVAASGGGGPKPPPKPLAQALHDSLAAPAPAGLTARIKFVNKLFPSGAITGQVGSALMSGASGRLWATNDGRGRLELQSDAGDVQVVWNDTRVTVFDASSNTVYRAKLPAHSTKSSEHTGVPSVAKISNFLTKIGEHVALSGARPSDVSHQAARSLPRPRSSGFRVRTSVSSATATRRRRSSSTAMASARSSSSSARLRATDTAAFSEASRPFPLTASRRTSSRRSSEPR